MEMVGLWERRASLVNTFSGGMKRRLEIARGLLHSPRVLFLDEPTVGLDPQTRSSIWRYIRELKAREDITIFLTTHYMDEAEYCDRIAIMDQGRIIVLDTPEALKAKVGKDRVQIETDDDRGGDRGAARTASGSRPRWSEGAVTFGVPEGEHFVPRLFAELGVPIRSVSVARPSLDDVFMSYTGTTIRDAESSSTDQHAQRREDDEPLMATETSRPAVGRAHAGAHDPGHREHAARDRARARPAAQRCAASCARSRSCGSAS